MYMYNGNCFTHIGCILSTTKMKNNIYKPILNCTLWIIVPSNFAFVHGILYPLFSRLLLQPSLSL